MGNAFSCSSESSDTSCSSVFASCKNDHCASSCSRAATIVAPAVEAAENYAESVIKKFIEDQLHAFLAEHVPNIVAAQLDAVAAAALHSDVIGEAQPVMPGATPL